MTIDAMMSETRKINPHAKMVKNTEGRKGWQIYDGVMLLGWGDTKTLAIKDFFGKRNYLPRETTMNKVRAEYPESRLSSCPTGFDVWSDYSNDAKIIGNGKTPRLAFESAYSALKAVRKARQKPMTVAEAKKVVLKRYQGARCGTYLKTEINRRFWYVTGVGGSMPGYETEGQAWKAAAAAIMAEEKGK